VRIPKDILLDTDLLIAARGGKSQAAVIFTQLTRKQLVISAITCVEFAIGERGNDPRASQSLNSFFAPFTIVAVDRPVYQQAMREAVRFGGGEKGKLRMPDLVIAATALVTGRTLLTRNVKDFRDIPNLKYLNWNA
jgi:predicted nucleic acid-binding protein